MRYFREEEAPPVPQTFLDKVCPLTDSFASMRVLKRLWQFYAGRDETQVLQAA